MKNLVLYIPGRGGSAAESAHYEPLFPGSAVMGLTYRAATPREAGQELRRAAEPLAAQYGPFTLIANSIGAYFAMHAGIDRLVRRAYFISPVVDMEGLILGMMARAGVTEAELEARDTILLPSGEELSWAYLRYVRTHPLRWRAPTEILYGSGDGLTDRETVSAFARACGAGLTVMPDGEHWFHTAEQMHLLDEWIREKEG